MKMTTGRFLNFNLKMFFFTLACLNSIKLKQDRETGKESVPSLVFLEEQN